MSDQPDRRPGHPLYRPDEDESLAAMPEQADTREAGSREVQSPATEGGASPLDQPVTGSASRSALQEAMSRSWGAVQSRHFAALVDEVVRFQKIEREQRVASEIRGERSKASQSAHHRKLAEAIDRAVRIDVHHSRPRSPVDVIAAVLASEGVVDPEGHRQLQEGWAALAALKDTAEAEVERLNQVVAWWMGEGSDETRHPEENEYLKLASVPESQRTKKQVARLGEIARLMRACSETSEYTKYREVERLKRIEGKYWEQTKVATDAESEVERLKAAMESSLKSTSLDVALDTINDALLSTGDSDE